ncbi:MAG: chemotaxis protein CheA [Marinobacterium sp.]|nr:chemotaxis protein CheA [Marinobacterium sp.]
MSIDLSQFIPTFLEESFEGLAVMESGLLSLSCANDTDCDAETINAIFRAAHSIKGGAGTFGFHAVSEFTHIAETLLDQLRGGQRLVSHQLVNLLLESVDCIRSLLESARDGVECSEPQVDSIARQLQALLDATEGQSADAGVVLKHELSANEKPAGWRINFIPEPQLLQTGNEPLLMFQALEDLGELTVEVNTKQLPILVELVPQTLCLQWTLTVRGDCERDQILEIFEWVEDECELTIEPLADPMLPPGPAVTPAVSHQTVTAVPSDVETGTTGQSENGVRNSVKNSSVKSSSVKNSNVSMRNTQPRKAGQEASSIRVDIDKVDALINRVGELVITQSMLCQAGECLMQDETLVKDNAATCNLAEGLSLLARNTRDLQEEVMRIRMLPISFVFNRFPRMVHDLSGQLGKQVSLTMAGEQTELDKTVMEKLGDPMVHLVRNSLDHGLELPEERIAAGKDAGGTVHLSACHQGGYILIEIRDDGRGLNTQKIFAKAVSNGLISHDASLGESDIHELIFMPGFSTAEEVSDLSGRGVGMDVVRRNIESLGGHVSVQSQAGSGSTFSIRLPLTLAILDGQLIRTGPCEIGVLPLVSIVESQQLDAAAIRVIAGQPRLYCFRDEYIPLIHLQQLFDLPGTCSPLEHCLLVIVEGNGQRAGLLVDELQGQQQVVIKSLERNYRRVPGLAGATILGNGSVALILDVPGVIRMAQQQAPQPLPGAVAMVEPVITRPATGGVPSMEAVEDLPDREVGIYG